MTSPLRTLPPTATPPYDPRSTSYLKTPTRSHSQQDSTTNGSARASKQLSSSPQSAGRQTANEKPSSQNCSTKSHTSPQISRSNRRVSASGLTPSNLPKTNGSMSSASTALQQPSKLSSHFPISSISTALSGRRPSPSARERQPYPCPPNTPHRNPNPHHLNSATRVHRQRPHHPQAALPLLPRASDLSRPPPKSSRACAGTRPIGLSTMWLVIRIGSRRN